MAPMEDMLLPPGWEDLDRYVDQPHRNPSLGLVHSVPHASTPWGPQLFPQIFRLHGRGVAVEPQGANDLAFSPLGRQRVYPQLTHIPQTNGPALYDGL
jgi:hypothetical protein